jgi:hypothetical protein
MDVFKFFKEHERMCHSYPDCCAECPAQKCHDCAPFTIQEVGEEGIKELIAIVEEWSKDHPVKTRQDVMLATFPGAEIDEEGVLSLSPCKVDKNYRTADGYCAIGSLIKCYECRKNYWAQEVEDNE